MNNNMKWCVCKFYYSAKNTITECESKEEAMRFANDGKQEAMDDESVVRYFVALNYSTKLISCRERNKMGKYMQNESLDIAVSAIVEEEIQKRKDNFKAEIESLRERLKSKQEQWDEKYKYLKFTVDSESKSGTFENNAIGM